MTELEWEYYMHPGSFYDGTLIRQVKGRTVQEMMKYKWKEPKMTNGEWLYKNGAHASDIEILNCGRQNGANIKYAIKLYCKTVSYIEVPSDNPYDVICDWLDAEHRELVLDESERKYLAAVIKPFRNRVEYIAKRKDGLEATGRLEIKTEASPWCRGFDYTRLPRFGALNAYKGMSWDKEYTLEDLGL